MALYKRGKIWWMNFWFDGRHVQKSTRCKNKRDAETVEHAYYTQLAKGEVGIETRTKSPGFKEAVKDFIKWSKVEHASKPNTYIRYEISTKPLLKHFGDIRIDRITVKEVENYKAWRSRQHAQLRGVKPKNGGPGTTRKSAKHLVAPATINRELACLKKMLNRLVRENALVSNPVSKVKLFSEDNRQTRVLNYADEKLYLMACSQPLRDFAIVMLETGMRPDEVRRMAITDVFLDKGFLQINEGKTKAARRRIPLTSRAYSILKTRITNAKCEFVFATMRGSGKDAKPIVKLNNGHYAAVTRSKVDKLRLYDLRHTFATRQAEAGTDLVTLAALLGHSRLEMVMRYAHPSENHKIDAMLRMEERRTSETEKSNAKAA